MLEKILNETPVINCGGTELDIYEIMHRFRNDGSCDYVIERALRQMAARQALREAEVPLTELGFDEAPPEPTSRTSSPAAE